MMTLLALQELAEKSNIEIDWFRMRKAESLSLPLSDGTCAVAIDPEKVASEPDELVKTAHEVGHCMTGAFYNRYAAFDVRQKHENRADRWAIEHLIPVEALDQAVADGYTTLWDLADHFGVTEDFMRKAVCLHTHGNLAADLFF